MASLLFRDAIDYARVRIYNRRYLAFGLQPRNCAMTPNGAIYSQVLLPARFFQRQRARASLVHARDGKVVTVRTLRTAHTRHPNATIAIMKALRAHGLGKR